MPASKISPPKGKNPPYAGTAVPVEASRAQIDKLLHQYGILDVQWTTSYSVGKVSIAFVTEVRGKPVMFRISPPSFSEKHRTYDAMKGRHVEVDAPNWARALRMLYFYLKAKLEAVAYGLREVEEEFLSDMVVRDAQGRETTVSELVLPAIESGGGRLALNAPVDISEAIDAEVSR